jgi:hypothetical protein
MTNSCRTLMATVDRFSPTSFEEQPHVHYQIRDNLDTPVLVFNSGSEGLGCERWTIPPGGQRWSWQIRPSAAVAIGPIPVGRERRQQRSRRQRYGPESHIRLPAARLLSDDQTWRTTGGVDSATTGDRSPRLPVQQVDSNSHELAAKAACCFGVRWETFLGLQFQMDWVGRVIALS